MKEIALYGKLAEKQPELYLEDMEHCFIYNAIYKFRRVISR